MTAKEIQAIISTNVSIVNKLTKVNEQLYVKLQEQLNNEMNQMTIEDYLKE